MKIFLLDANVLIALSWPASKFHEAAHRWFERRGLQGWATCPFTETSFVRMASNPAIFPLASTPVAAMSLLNTMLQLHSHHFWPDDIGLETAVARFPDRLRGHQQVTDGYLLGLARHHRGALATFDQGIRTLAAAAGALDHLEIIPFSPPPFVS